MGLGLALPVVLLAALLGAGCATPDDAALSERLTARAVAGDFNSIALTDIRCNARTEDCAKSHAVKGDACLKLAIQQPQTASIQDSKMRDLLDCAEAGYSKALELQPDRNAPSRVSYHGGLLLTLSERLYRATLKPRGRDRCNDLRQAESMLSRSPSPPIELTDEQNRIRSLIRQQLRENGCGRIQRL